MAHEIRVLVAEMATANPFWGAPRIHGELAKLGLAVSERTVSRLLPHRRRPPSQTWRTFLASHVPALVSMDFFTASTLTGCVLFVLVLLAHHRRRSSRSRNNHAGAVSSGKASITCCAVHAAVG